MRHANVLVGVPQFSFALLFVLLSVHMIDIDCGLHHADHDLDPNRTFSVPPRIWDSDIFEVSIGSIIESFYPRRGCGIPVPLEAISTLRSAETSNTCPTICPRDLYTSSFHEVFHPPAELRGWWLPHFELSDPPDETLEDPMNWEAAYTRDRSPSSSTESDSQTDVTPARSPPPQLPCLPPPSPVYECPSPSSSQDMRVVNTTRPTSLGSCWEQARQYSQASRKTLKALTTGSHRFVCLFCEQSFRRRHDGLRHQGFEKRTCDGCSQDFPRSDARGRHWDKDNVCRLAHAAMSEENAAAVRNWERRRNSSFSRTKIVVKRAGKHRHRGPNAKSTSRLTIFSRI